MNYEQYSKKIRPKIGWALGIIVAIGGAQSSFTEWFDSNLFAGIAYSMNLSFPKESTNIVDRRSRLETPDIVDLQTPFEREGYPRDLWSPVPPEGMGVLKVELTMRAERVLQQRVQWEEESIALLHRAGRFGEMPLSHMDEMGIEMELILAFDETLKY